MKQTELLSLRSEVEAIRLSNLIQTISRRHFNEFWTSGNDIDVEGAWRWAGDTEGRGVPSFGWTEQSFSSIEENCLVWVVELVAGQETDGWHPASCCNMHQFICSRPLWCDTNIEKYIKSVTSDYHHPQLRMMWQIVERVFQIWSCRLWWLECNVSQLKSDDGLYQEKYQKFRYFWGSTAGSWLSSFLERCFAEGPGLEPHKGTNQFNSIKSPVISYQSRICKVWVRTTRSWWSVLSRILLHIQIWRYNRVEVNHLHGHLHQ